MKIIGIIAEYNPFHNGHAYQIKRIKEQMQADFVVAAMSGNFVQRGAPAMIDKYVRAQMALNCGIDLVLELPVLWATASAEAFAMAGVTLFDKMGCVDGICFGAESNNLPQLSLLADILSDEPNAYCQLLSGYLKKGMTFPAARSQALCAYFSKNASAAASFTLDEADISKILNSPNNILAIEYLKAIKRRNSALTPYLIKRLGAGYHEEHILESSQSLSGNPNPAHNCNFDSFLSDCLAPTASATAIRKELNAFSGTLNCTLPDSLTLAMPDAALSILKEALSCHTLLQSNDFSAALGYRLLTSDTDTLSAVGDANKELANRLQKNRIQFSSFTQFCELCKSKDITYTRLSRVLLHLLLGITANDYAHGQALDFIPYLRILGFRKDAAMLLKTLKKNAQVPVLAKLANASSILDADAQKLLALDIFAADLYTQTHAVKSQTHARSEFSQQILRV